MVDTIPPWFAKLDALVGTQEVRDAAKIVALADDIGRAFPEMLAYAHLMKDPHTQSWCGFILGAMFALCGIRPPYDPSDDLKSFMWVDSFETFGTPVTIGQEQLGDVMILKDTSIHHVDLFSKRNGDGTYEGLGGNQGDSVKYSNYNVSHIHAVRRPPAPVNSAPGPVNSVQVVTLDSPTIAKIVAAAASSDLAHWSWNDRGRAPIGYIQGMAVSFAQVLERRAAGDSVSNAMVRIVDAPGEHDVFDQYADIFTSLGMTFDAPNIDRLRLLWVVLTGLGMRESSGGVDIGRDTSASNTSADTAEAGTWQQSWDSHGTSPELPKLLAAYAGSAPDDVDAIFKQGVTPNAGAFENFGDPNSDGYKFQALVKARPSIAALFAAIGMRTLYNHWGPLINRAAEIVPAADVLFRQVQEIVDAPQVAQATAAKGPAMTDQTPQPSSSNVGIGGAGGATVTIGTGGSGGIFPAVPVPITKIDFSKFVDFFENNKDDAVKGMTRLNALLLAIHPDASIGLPTPTAPAPTLAPATLQGKTLGDLLSLPSVQIGAVGGIVSGVVHWFGVVDPNLTIGATILSAATAGLGLTGIWGQLASGAISMLGPLIKNVIQQQMQAQAQQPHDPSQQPPLK